MAIKQGMPLQCQGGPSYILKSNRRSGKFNPWRAKHCNARVGGWEGGGGWLGDGVQDPMLSGSPSHVLVKCHPSHHAWLACAHGPPSNSPATVPPASAPPEPCWKIAHKLKEISFQQTSLWRIGALSSPSRMSAVHFTS